MMIGSTEVERWEVLEFWGFVDKDILRRDMVLRYLKNYKT